MANDELGSMIVRVGIDGSGMDRGLKSINERLNATRSELKATASRFDNFGGSVDGLRAKQENLTRQQQLQGEKVKQLKQQYEDLTRVHGAESEAALRAASRLNQATATYYNLGRTIQTVDSQISEMTEELDRQNSAFGRAESALTSFSDRAGRVGGTLKSIGEGLTVGVSAPIAALGGIALKAASDFEASQGKMQAALGLTKEEAKDVNESARSIWKEGFGTDMAEASQGIIDVRKNLQDITGEELEDVTRQAFILRDTFGYEIPESTRAAKALIDQFGVDGAKAMDYITVATQKGAGFSDELLDVISEYSSQFKTAGMDIDGMFNILLQGAQNGAFSLDKVGDSVKEFAVRAVDGSKTTAEGFSAIGLSADDMGAKFAEGGDSAEKAFMATVAGLASMKDPLKQQQAGVALFGTQWEDVSKNVIGAMDPTVDMLGEVAGATEKAGKALADNLGARVQTELRELGDTLIPFGNVLMDIIDPALESTSEKIEEFTNWMKGLSPESQKTILSIAGIVAAIGPLMIGLGFAASGIGAVAGALALLTNPIGLSVLALAGLGLGFAALDQAMDKPIAKSDIFKGKVSNATKEILGSYQTLRSDAETELTRMADGNEKLTDQHVANIIAKYQTMNSEVLKQLDTRYQQERAKLAEFFKESDTFTAEEEAKQLIALDEKYAQDREKTVKQGEEIFRIIQESKNKEGKITEEAYVKIGEITNQQDATMIANSVKSSQEQETILRNLKDQSEAITLEKALKVANNSKKQKDETVKHANDEANETIKMAEYKRDVTGDWSAEQADAVIAEAQREKDDAVNLAKRQHDDVVMAAYDRAGANADQANWETNAVLGWQQQLANGVIKASNWVKRIFGLEEDDLIGSLKESGYMKQKRQAPQLKGSYAKGTSNGTHPGGLALVSELGRELINEPGVGTYLSGSSGPELRNLRPGTSVLPNKHTEKVLRNYGFPGYADGVGDFFSAFSRGTDSVWDFVSDKFKLSSYLDNMPNRASKMMGDPLKSVGSMAQTWLEGLFPDMESLGVGGSGVQRWAGIATQALMMEGQYTKANLDRLLYQMQTESGGNPRAINLWDSNAKKGIPSKGLLQTIDPTFRAYARPGYNKDVYDPLSNILASIRYATSRYGTLANAYRGVGYATGGEINYKQMAMLGENGYKEWVLTSEPKYRNNNLSMWMEAGQAMGVPVDTSTPSARGRGATNPFGGGTSQSQNEGLEMLVEAIEQLAGRPIYFSIDGREIANATWKATSELISHNENRKLQF